MNDINKYLKSDLFARQLGIELLTVSPGKAKAKIKITQNHLNSAGTVHGGAIFALADFAFESASNSYGTLALGINVNISYFKAVSSGILYAEAKEISFNPKLATYLINITNERGDIIALFQGTVYRKKDKLSDIIRSNK